jgi:HAMP domain-containing protein
MLVICEECAKKYNIDTDQIQDEVARFSCFECGHMIVVEKPSVSSSGMGDEEGEISAGNEDLPGTSDRGLEESEPSTADDEITSDTATENGEVKQAHKKVEKTPGRGMPLFFYLFFTMTATFLTICAVIGYLYFQYIPALLNEQIELRTSAIASTFQGVLERPMLLKNYLQVNKEAERFSKLPGVAYAAVLNDRNVVIAGFFSDLDRFTPNFAHKVRTTGFPVDMFPKNQTSPSQNKATFTIGGQIIQDKELPLPNSGGVVHIGVYTEDIKNTVRSALLSPLSLTLLSLVFLSGLLAFLLLARFITRPLQKLTDLVHRISLGELDLAITPQGPREIRDLGVAFDRMRFSIKSALERLRNA